MSNIKPGNYTVREIFDRAGFDINEKASADYASDGIDRRRVRIGGLPFDDEDKVIHVPVTANELEISVDGKADVTLQVELDDEDKKLRSYSFEHAAEASEE
jgi:hypothetical protein